MDLNKFIITKINILNITLSAPDMLKYSVYTVSKCAYGAERVKLIDSTSCNWLQLSF